MARLAHLFDRKHFYAEFPPELDRLRVAAADAEIVNTLDGLEKRVREAKKLVRQTESKVEELGDSIKQMEQSAADKNK